MAKWDIKPTTLMGMMGYIQIMLAARGKPKIIRTWSFFNVFHGNAVLGSVMWRMCFSRGKEKCGSFGKCINMLFNYFLSMGRFNKNQLFVMFDHVFCSMSGHEIWISSTNNEEWTGAFAPLGVCQTCFNQGTSVLDVPNMTQSVAR